MNLKFENHWLWGDASGKELACQCRKCKRSRFDRWVGKILWRRKWQPTPVFWPVEFHGLHSPWGHKELDTTERLSLHFTLFIVAFLSFVFEDRAKRKAFIFSLSVLWLWVCHKWSFLCWDMSLYTNLGTNEFLSWMLDVPWWSSG